jgi:hypothetical protein
VGGLGDHAINKSAEKPFMSGYFPPAVPPPFLHRTGIAGKAGEI